jgi:hypothetical protein
MRPVADKEYLEILGVLYGRTEPEVTGRTEKADDERQRIDDSSKQSQDRSRYKGVSQRV